MNEEKAIAKPKVIQEGHDIGLSHSTAGWLESTRKKPIQEVKKVVQKEKKVQKQEKPKVIPKHDKELFPAVPHKTIVRPRFLRSYELNDNNETWVTKVINEKNQTIDSYSDECFGKVENKYKEFLNKY